MKSPTLVLLVGLAYLTVCVLSFDFGQSRYGLGGRNVRRIYSRYDGDDESDLDDDDDDDDDNCSRNYRFGRYSRNRNRGSRYRNFYSTEDEDSGEEYTGRCSSRRCRDRRRIRERRRQQRGRQRCKERRRRKFKNENLLEDLDGPRKYGDSCVTTYRLRDGGRRDRLIDELTFDATRRALVHCNKHILRWRVDTNRRRGGGRGGCVFRDRQNIPDRFSPDPNVYLNKPIYNSRERRRTMRSRRVRKYRCGNRRILKNQIDVAAQKEYCRRLHHYVSTRRCSACKLKVILFDTGTLTKCTGRKLRRVKSPAAVYHYTEECLREEARDLDDC